MKYENPNTKGNVVIFVSDGKTVDALLSHEGAHNLEEGIRKISKDPEFRKRIEYDMNQRRKGKVDMTHLPDDSRLGEQADDMIWISDYAEHPITTENWEHVETWAECVAAYVNEPVWFKHNYRKTHDYIDKMFKNYEKRNNMKKNSLRDKLKSLFEK